MNSSTNVTPAASPQGKRAASKEPDSPAAAAKGAARGRLCSPVSVAGDSDGEEVPSAQDKAKREAAVLAGKARPSLWMNRGLFCRRTPTGTTAVSASATCYMLLDWVPKFHYEDAIEDELTDNSEDRENDLLERDANVERRPGAIAGDHYILCEIDMEKTATTLELPEFGTDEYEILAKRVIAVSPLWRPVHSMHHLPSFVRIPLRFRYRDASVATSANLWLKTIPVTSQRGPPTLTSHLEADKHRGKEHHFWAIRGSRIDWERRRREIDAKQERFSELNDS